MPDDFQFDVFLSHSSKDKAVVRPLAERLRQDGVKVWFDEWVLKPGDSIPSKIEEGLERSRVLVLCMSAHAFGSDWAQLEAGTFRFRDPLNKERRFLPLRLDDFPINGSLAQFLYVNWRPAGGEQEYAKLLEACREPQKWPKPVEAERSWPVQGKSLTGLVALVLVGAIIAATLAGAMWSKLRSPRLGREPDNADFKEWAGRVNSRSATPTQQAIAALSPANKLARPVYERFVSELREELLTCRKTRLTNLYIDLPDLPDNLFALNATPYSGGAIFSRDAAWSFFLVAPKDFQSRTGPELRLEFMDGDGHSKGGVGIGTFRLVYNFDTDEIQIDGSGVAAVPLRGLPNKIQRSAFESAIKKTVRALAEYQLANAGL